CLIVLDGRTPDKHHDLRKHFDVLPPCDKDAIMKGYDDVLRTDPGLRAEYERLRQDGQNPGRIFDFDTVLDDSARAFEKSRYPYDPQYKAHTYLAVPIEIAARKVIVAMHPAWDNALQNLISRPDTPPTSRVP